MSEGSYSKGTKRKTDYNSEERSSRKSKGKRDSYDDSNQEYDWGAPAAKSKPTKDSTEDGEGEEEKKEPEYKPNFGLTGALAKDEKTGNTKKGIVLKFSEPAEASIPDKRWRLYVYKGDELVDTLHIHRQNNYLLGRDQRVADIPMAHPSCSLQHAVIQFRAIDKKVIDDEGFKKREKFILPYLMDLNSTHKTYLNGEVIEDSRYYELRPMDVLKFGESTREYILLHEDAIEKDSI